MLHTDTIAAIATYPSNSGIGIIRVSGDDAIAICESIFKSKVPLHEMSTHTISYGFIFDGEEKIDEVLVSLMRGPRSYTMEDVVEINCHGGIFILQRILSLLFRKGARPAEAGEFTKRAFLNGRIDLTQAESVMDLISSENEKSRQNSMNQLSGVLSAKLRSLRGAILHEVAYIESALDDPEHISLDGYADALSSKIDDFSNQLQRLISSADDGMLLKSGIRTVIVGKPNVGKSSLLNMLSNKERAIVTDIPGTTRDILEEKVRIGDITLHIMDTAGIRQTDDVVEQIGVRKAEDSLSEADLILYVVDSSVALDENDRRIQESLKEHYTHTIVLLNKSDLNQVVLEDDLSSYGLTVIPVSMMDGSGVEVLKNAITHMFFHGDISANDDLMITNERHKFLLEQANRSLALVKDSIDLGVSEDFFAGDLMDAYESLGSIVGEAVEDDLVNEIFSKFCMGK
ncbi:MAG: tRNA uridine-5-carboxymethylaminomethyl(34) synthesis GTPase MnmE [Lachnospiraceae bacterium]|nr:tRNA uridine-5-carboxymethylaminomethyl(34) synthesis GTPase MnmE [Lachnospiraceae bacterium]